MLGLNLKCPKILCCLGKAIADKGLRGLLGEVPYAGFMYEICADAWSNYREERQDEDIARAIPRELEQLAQANPVELEQQVRLLAAEILPGQSVKVQEALAGTLMLVPGQIRKTFIRKDDLTGKTRPPTFVLHGPQDLVPIMPPRPPRFKEGDPLPNDPKWVLIKRLDSGGFGEVWQARHLTLTNRLAAVKFCLDAAAQDRLLKHEARVINQVMQLKNDHIVKLEEVDFNPDAPWLRYEFIEGGNLLTSVSMPDEIDRRAVWARNIILPLARTVGACHLLNPPVVHRDLKPANILLELIEGTDGKTRPRLKITDFGISEIIAQQTLDHVRRETAHHASFATPTLLRGSYTALYASDQQKAGMPSAPTDDVYSLGVMWFQLLMGDYFLPLGRDYRDDLADLKLGEEVIQVLSKCVADRAERRWPNAKVLAQEIEKLAKPAIERREPAIRSEPVKFVQEQKQSMSIIRPKEQPALLDCTQPLGIEPQDVKLAQKQWADWLGVPVEETIQLGSIKLLMILVPPGKFMMGSPDSERERGTDEILHEVELTQPYYLGKYPVTQEQYTQVMQVPNPSWFCASGDGNDAVKRLETNRFPVEQVTWKEAADFCHRLGGCGRGRFTAFRLPTEAEWEYACRAGTRTLFHFGTSLNGTEANCDGNFPCGTVSKGKYLLRTTEVGSYPCNAFGLCDMHGNVWEWCMDWYGKYDAAKYQNPTGPNGGTARVHRGGGWNYNARRCRSAVRDRNEPTVRFSFNGFRLALVPTGL